MNDGLDSECSSGCESGWTVYFEENSFLSPYDSLRANNDNSNDKIVEGIIGNASVSYQNQEKRPAGKHEEAEEEDDDGDDLSMVSDASSGPPHFTRFEDYGHGDKGYCCLYNEPNDAAALLPNNGGGKRQRKKKIKEARSTQNVQEHHHHHHHHQTSFLDDTASSPIFDFSNNEFTVSKNQDSRENMLEYSHGYSTTQFEGSSPFQEHFSLFQTCPSQNQMQQNQWV